MLDVDAKLKDLSKEIKVYGSIVIIGSGTSLSAGMPLCQQLAPIIWQVVDEHEDIKFQINSNIAISAKKLLGEKKTNLKRAFKLIKNNQSASLKFKKLFVAINNSHNQKVSITHKNICKLIHEGFIELVISLNWDDLIESSWERQYGTQINKNKRNLLKPHGDVRDVASDWIFPHEPGRISKKDLDYVNQLAAIRPRTLIIIGYSEQDEVIVNKIIAPNEKRWKIFRISPDAVGSTSIICTAEKALNSISNILISKTESYWKHIDFSKQRDLGPAILGYKLTPADVCVCPRLPQILEAKSKLDVAHSVLIKGSPGCGKSITAFQIAYDFSQEGWEAVRFSDSRSDRLGNIELPDTLYKTIYVIDDAQQLKQSIITKMLESSNERSKVIITQAIDCDLPFESISISKVQSVDTLYEEYLKRRNEILTVVKKCDSNIGDSYMDTPIEWRLKDAAKGKSPWLFNYILRGGWKQVKSQFLAVKEVERADILIAIIALKQITSLDKSVNRIWLNENIKRFGKDTEWCDRTLTYLYSSKIIIDITEIRTLHLESAVRIIGNFLLESSQDERKIFNSMIQNEFVNNNCPLMGISWFLNSINTFDCSHNLFHFVLTPHIVSKIMERCFNSSISEERASAAYVIDFIVGRKYGSLTFKEVIGNYPILYDWIENVDGTTAYVYSKVLNNVLNEDHTLKKEFVSKLNINKIAQQMASMAENDLYSWGNFIERISTLQDKKWQTSFFEKFPQDRISTVIQKTSINNIGGLAELLCGLYCFNQKYAHCKLRECLPIFKKGFENDLSETWASLDPIFSLYFFGVHFFSRTKPNKLQRETIISTIALISEDVLSESITQGRPRDWERIYDLISLIDNYDKKKLINALGAVDLSILDQTTVGLWKIQTRELMLLCNILEAYGNDLANKWIYKHRDDIDILCVSLVSISPKTAGYLIDKNYLVELCQNSWWEISAKAVKKLKYYNKNLAFAVIRINQKKIIDQLNELKSIDCDNIYLFIKEIKKVDIQIANEIFNNINIKTANSNWKKCIVEQQDQLRGFSKLLTEIQNCSQNGPLLVMIQIMKELIKEQESKNSLGTKNKKY